MTKTKDEPNNEVTNFYEVMPKKYLKKRIIHIMNIIN